MVALDAERVPQPVQRAHVSTKDRVCGSLVAFGEAGNLALDALSEVPRPNSSFLPSLAPRAFPFQKDSLSLVFVHRQER